MPETYMCPKEFPAFKQAFKAGTGAWIWKPNACARGIGIKLVTKLDQVRAQPVHKGSTRGPEGVRKGSGRGPDGVRMGSGRVQKGSRRGGVVKGSRGTKGDGGEP
eukprot:1186932-Prorocentrum_minimum.AAC.1